MKPLRRMSKCGDGVWRAVWQWLLYFKNSFFKKSIALTKKILFKIKNFCNKKMLLKPFYAVLKYMLKIFTRDL